jgi:tight adherence protein B
MAFAGVALGSIGLALLLEWYLEWRQRQVVQRQLRSLTDRREGAGSDVLRGDDDQLGWLGGVGQQGAILAAVNGRIEKAGVKWTAQSYLVITFGLAMGFGVATLLVTGFWVAAFGASAAGAWIPWVYLKKQEQKRIDAFEEQLPEAIDFIGRAIRAGHPLSAGLKMASEEVGEPVASEFRRVFEEQRFGMPFEDALLGLVDRINLTDVRIMITAILIQRQVGGNLAEVLDKIAYTIRERFMIRRQLRVYTAQGRFSGYVLALLPIAVGSAIYLINKEYMVTLFTDPIARILLVVAVIMQILGYLWIKKIVNIEI